MFSRNAQLSPNSMLTFCEQVALQSTLTAGDRLLTLLNLGTQAHFRVIASYDCTEIETYVDELPLDLKNWLPGRAFAAYVRQSLVSTHHLLCHVPPLAGLLGSSAQ